MAKFFVSLLTLANLTVAVASLLPPYNVTKGQLNLNFEVRWSAPSDRNNSTRYTVEYSSNNKIWYNISECTAIRRTECTDMTRSLMDLLGQRRVHDTLLTGFLVHIYRHDGPLVHDSSLKRDARFSPYTEATMSAPSILKLDATSDSQRVGLLAPQTPFVDRKTGRHILIDDTNLRGVSKVYYNYTLQCRGSIHCSADTARWETKDEGNNVPSKHGMHNYTILQLSNLHPNTLYALTVQARIGTGPYSTDTARMVWTTQDAVPSQGPSWHILDLVEVDCSKPDSRDVRVKWQPPPHSQWNSDSLYYEVRFSRMGPGGEHVTLNVTSSTSTTVYNLSRWDRYDVVVFANNSAGGTPSLPKSIETTNVGMANSKPEDIRILTDPLQPTQVIAWEPPSGYQQCILGYNVTLQPEAGIGKTGDLKRKKTVVNGTELELEGLEPDVYIVEVAAIVKTGFGTTSQGMAGTVRMIVGPVRNSDGVIASVIVVSVLVVCLLSGMTYRKIIKTFKDEKFKSLKNNKILKRASSQTYSSLRRHEPEKETYDLLNQREPLERQTSSLSRDSGASNRTTSSSGYSTDAKSGAVDDISLSDNDEGKAPAGDVIFTSWLRQSLFMDDEVKDNVFTNLHEAASDEETNQSDAANHHQSSTRVPTDPVLPYSALSSGYTPVSSCCPSRQTSVNEDSSAFRKTSKVSCDSAPTTPYLESYPPGLGLDYTVLGSLTQCSSQPHPLAVIKSDPGESREQATSEQPGSNSDEKAPVKTDPSPNDLDTEDYSKSSLV